MDFVIFNVYFCKAIQICCYSITFSDMLLIDFGIIGFELKTNKIIDIANIVIILMICSLSMIITINMH